MINMPRINKQRQLDILLKVNDILREDGIKSTVYLFGGNSLIAHDVISRTTKDMDFFMFFVFDSPAAIVEKIKAQFDFRIDIGLNGEFNIESKGYKWVLPKNAYARASRICDYSNLELFALSPLDIVVLKCDRLNERDERDVISVFNALRPSREGLVGIFEEYSVY